MSSLSLPWRRRPSALFVPGAWPHVSTSTQNLLGSPSEEPQSPVSDMEVGEGGEQNWKFATKLERLPFEDHIGVGLGCAVASVARRHLHEIHSVPFGSPEVDPPPLSASLSLHSTFTDGSTAASEGVLTPEQAFPPHVPWIEAVDTYPTRSRCHSDPSSAAPEIKLEPSATAFPTIGSGAPVLHISPFESQQLNRSFLAADAAPCAPRLSLRSSQLSLSYATAPSFPDDSDAEEPPAPSLPRSRASSIPSSFNIPVPDAEDPDQTLDQESVPLATDFYPVPSNGTSAEDLRPSRPSFVSTRSSAPNRLDSPVLPPQDSSRRFSVQTLSPSAADLDAFALAAIEASQSLISIPTSLHSASPSGYEPSASDCTREPSFARPSSTILSSGVALENQSTNRLPDCDYREGCECGFDYDPDEAPGTWRGQGSRRARPTPVTRASMTRSVSSRVDVGMANSVSSRQGRRRSLVLGRVKKLGGKVLGWLKISKAGGEPREKVDVQTTTTTALTAVEYRSPLPSPKPRTLLRPLSGFVSPTGSPREERRNSFHPFDVDSRPVISLPRALSKHAIKESSNKSRRTSAISDASQRSRRARTQTAPPSQLLTVEGSSTRPTNTRRFSLSSALTMQHLESVRAMVEPRPTLSLLCPPTPEFSPTSPTSAASSVQVRGTYAEAGSATGSLAPAFSEPDSAATEKPQDSLLPPSTSLPGLTPPSSPSHLQPDSPQIIHAASQPNTPMLGQPKRPGRARGFSLSSVVSKRAIRAKSMIVSVGRRDENASLGTPQSSRRDASTKERGSVVSTIPVEGVQFDIVSPTFPPLTPRQSTPRTPRTRHSACTIAASENDARSERAASMTDISFANTRGMSSLTSFSSLEFGIGSDTTASGSYCHTRSATFGLFDSEITDVRKSTEMVRLDGKAPVAKTLELSLSESFAQGSTSFATQPEELDRLELAERQEDISFMRALGLEFDEIAKRADHCL